MSNPEDAKKVFSRSGSSFLTLSKRYAEKADTPHEAPPPPEHDPRATQMRSPSSPTQALRQTIKQEMFPERWRENIEEAGLEDAAEKITDTILKIEMIWEGIKFRLNQILERILKILLIGVQVVGYYGMKIFDRLLILLRPVIRICLIPFRPFVYVGRIIVERFPQRRQVAIAQKHEELAMQAAMTKGDAEDESLPALQEPIQKITFLELVEKGIIFTDNRKRPLYSLEMLKSKMGYAASSEVTDPLIMEDVIYAFREVAPKARSIPPAQSGRYAGIPLDIVMGQVSDDDIMLFLNYVNKFPRGYIGKNFRITESFAGWVVSGTPDD